jgi:anthraniloyl-CoA monooxygenase
MRAAGLGGRPGGLYCGISLKRRDPAHDAVERDRPGDSFGWGAVLSDETFGNLHANDAGGQRWAP